MIDPIFQAHRAFGRAVAENQLRDEQVDPLSAAIAAYLRAVAEQLPLQAEPEPSEHDGSAKR